MAVQDDTDTSSDGVHDYPSPPESLILDLNDMISESIIWTDYCAQLPPEQPQAHMDTDSNETTYALTAASNGSGYYLTEMELSAEPDHLAVLNKKVYESAATGPEPPPSEINGPPEYKFQATKLRMLHTALENHKEKMREMARQHIDHANASLAGLKSVNNRVGRAGDSVERNLKMLNYELAQDVLQGAEKILKEGEM